MKEALQLKNYRLKYKRYYGIDFDENYVIHHIDFDRTNNDISNLLLLPKELHAKYHMIISSFGGSKNKGIITFNARIPEYGRYYSFKMLEQLIEVEKQIRGYVARKAYLDRLLFESEHGG